MRRAAGVLAVFLCLGIVLPGGAFAYDPNHSEPLANEIPKPLKDIGITEKLGETVDLTLPFVSDTGESVRLNQYFTGTKPVLLTIVYYNCANLCNFHLNGVTEALKQLKWTAGQEFELVAVSMDAKEGPAVAGPKKANYLKEYGRLGAETGWHFLTGSEENIRKLADQVGFQFRWDDESKQFAHSSAAIIVTPHGVISRYLHGIQPDPRNLRLAMIEASDGRVGTMADRLIMFCFKFDPKKSKYTLAAWKIMQVGVVTMILIMAAILIPAWVRERRHQGSA